LSSVPDPPTLYIVTDRRAAGGRALPDIVAAALTGGPPGRVAVQLREKDLGARELLELAQALRAVTAAGAARNGVPAARLFINDRIDVALACGADGVHLPANSLPLAELRSRARPLALAASAHDANQVAAARAAGADFVVFGPVFDTPAKRRFGPPRGLAALAQAARAAGAVPVLAIGGVTVENGPLCLAAGARGVACIRAVMSATDAAAVVRAFFAGFGRS